MATDTGGGLRAVTRDSFHDFLSRHFVAVVAAVLSAGITVGVVRAELQNKADAATVEMMAGEIADIKYLLCKQTPEDSTCNPRRRATRD